MSARLGRDEGVVDAEEEDGEDCPQPVRAMGGDVDGRGRWVNIKCVVGHFVKVLISEGGDANAEGELS